MRTLTTLFICLWILLSKSAFAVDAWSEKFKIRLVETSLNSKQVTVWPIGPSVPVSNSACSPRTYFRFNDTHNGVLGYDAMLTQLMIASSSGLEVRFYGQCDPNSGKHDSRVLQVSY